MADDSLNNDKDECSSPKKMKLETETTKNTDNSIHNTEVDLSNFEVKRILNNNCTRKQISVEGLFKGYNDPAIVLLEKKNFPGEELFLKRGFFNESTILRKVQRNHIYGNYDCFPTREYNGLHATVIHPATTKHIEKFEKKEFHIIDETYELYQKITVPYIESNSFSMEWIDNILTHKAEADKIIYEHEDHDTGFIMVPDMKWDGELGSLKFIALPFQKIKCIRELNASHLPLLKNIQDAGTTAITKKFSIPASRLRIYFHYQPSYYYLHVHFSYLMFEAPGIHVEKAHLLSTVIRNIELMPDYYSKTILSYAVPEKHPLFIKFKEYGVVREIEPISEKV